MPLFYLHVCNGNGFIEDEEGHELHDADAARAKATTGARDIMSEDMRAGQLNLASFIEVEDENHVHLFTVTFAEAVDISDKAPPPRTESGNRSGKAKPRPSPGRGN